MQVQQDLQKLAWPGREWVLPRSGEDGSHMYDGA
jgi:hypothetical protein